MRATRAVINLTALAQNFQEIKEFIGPNKKICVAVKADAYGHGAVQCAKTLSEAGADMFGLATAEEARELLQYGISTPLLLLGLVCPEELPELIDGGVALVAGDRDYLEKIWKIAATLDKPVRIHLKVDLGMGRLG